MSYSFLPSGETRGQTSPLCVKREATRRRICSKSKKRKNLVAVKRRVTWLNNLSAAVFSIANHTVCVRTGAWYLTPLVIDSSCLPVYMRREHHSSAWTLTTHSERENVTNPHLCLRGSLLNLPSSCCVDSDPLQKHKTQCGSVCAHAGRLGEVSHLCQCERPHWILSVAELRTLLDI